MSRRIKPDNLAIGLWILALLISFLLALSEQSDGAPAADQERPGLSIGVSVDVEVQDETAPTD